MAGKLFLLALLMLLVIHIEGSSSSEEPNPYPEDSHKLKLWLTISARRRFLEVSWKNAPAHRGDYVLLTKQDPTSFEKLIVPTGTPLASFNNEEASGFGEASVDYIPVHGVTGKPDTPSPGQKTTARKFWSANGGTIQIVAAIQPSEGLSSQWFTTGVPFDYALSQNVTVDTSCYGFWASYIDGEGRILAKTCLRAYPRWMNELKSLIGEMRLRDLFIPGTHDSGSYRPDFDPLLKESLVTKYALCQDDDIRGQLMHGVRYLDIRVGYYQNSEEKFFIYHGITKQRPLQEVVDQVKDFVLETNEIIIFGLKEFPVGFGKGLNVHHLLVSYLREQFEGLIAHPSLTWRATLRDIWTRKQNIFLAYDRQTIVDEYPHLLYGSVEQRWGNVQTWPRLEQYLRNINDFDVSRFTSRPVADMAELTPETWDVILDKHGGLRKMADNINWRISHLYRDELGVNANIVAADFIRGTTLVDTAIQYNRRKIYA
ncbi:hypothetical protein KR074_002958 [Drosophila pseudoananassae]|nr:hypothetical protein KR074_002958 [Drosophila pseudoananassae]